MNLKSNFLMNYFNWLRLYTMLVREWERVKKKDWFNRLDQTPAELERSKFLKLLGLSYQIAESRIKPGVPLTLKTIMLDKERELVELPLQDQLIQGVLRQILDPQVKRLHSDSVHSFIKGRSVVTAFNQILKELKTYRKKTKQKERALFVLRADIKKCGESIPVHPKSPLWPLVFDLIPKNPPIPHDSLRSELIRNIRPTLQWRGVPGPFQLLKGVPTGSPLQPMILNLYLSQLDRFFESHRTKNSHMIYSRYGDDFFFAHSDPEVFENAKKGFFERVEKLELETRPEKIQTFRWSGSGFQGRSTVEFLGFELHFNGRVRVNPKKYKVIVNHLRHIIRKSFHVMKDEPLPDRIDAARRMLERSIGIKSRNRHPYLDRLLSVGNDRAQLLALDHEITYSLAKEIVGFRHPSVFRFMRKRTLYQKFKIPSLVALRNSKCN